MKKFLCLSVEVLQRARSVTKKFAPVRVRPLPAPIWDSPEENRPDPRRRMFIEFTFARQYRQRFSARGLVPRLDRAGFLKIALARQWLPGTERGGLFLLKCRLSDPGKCGLTACRQSRAFKANVLRSHRLGRQTSRNGWPPIIGTLEQSAIKLPNRMAQRAGNCGKRTMDEWDHGQKNRNGTYSGLVACFG